MTEAADRVPVPVQAFSTPSAVTFLGFRGSGQSPGLTFPGVHFEPLSPATFGANFQFVVVPEPATWAVLACGWLLGTGTKHETAAAGGDETGGAG